MAWIKMIKEDEAYDYLKTLYKKYGDPFEGVANIWKIHSLNPDSLKLHYDFNKHLMTGKSGLSRMQREMIGIVVSSINQNQYCLTHHEDSLFQLTKNRPLIDGLKTDFRKLDIGEKDICMLEFAEKITIHPAEIEKSDVEKLRSLGFQDPEILDISLVAAYFSFITRITAALGVELEDYWKDK